MNEGGDRDDPSRFAVPEVREATIRRSHRIIWPIARRYFRSEVRHMERVPEGQTILVQNHDGGMLPLDAVCFGAHWHEYFDFKRPLYVLTHDIFFAFGKQFTRLLNESGMMRADREAMDAALAQGRTVLVLPGAARESFRTFWQRRDIDLGGRKGFVAQALRWNIPITPVVSVGGHETLFVLYGGHALARKINLPKLVRSADIFPLIAGVPWGIWFFPALPQWPLPAKITIEIQEPVRMADVLGREPRPEDADNEQVVDLGYRAVVDRMRAAAARLYDERRWPVLG